jgi:pyruvate kinase
VLRTETGSTALLHAKYRANVPIIALTTEMSTARQMLLSRNVTPIKIDSVAEVGSLISDIITRSKKSGLVQPVPPLPLPAVPRCRE